VPIAFHRRTASRRVDHDRLDIGGRNRVDQPFGRRDGFLLFSRMLGERAAALLRLRDDHFTAFGRQHTRRRLIHISEKHTLNAAQQ
jgi:hypothetical protein